MKKQGFTLIELLVVIAIISLLMAILMPSLRSAREQGREVVCKTQLRGIGQAMYLYAHDYNDYVSVEATASGVVHTAFDGHTYKNWDRKWYVRYAPYYESPDMVRCPSTTEAETWVGFEDNWVLKVGDKRIPVTYTGQECIFRSTDQVPTGIPGLHRTNGRRQFRLSQLGGQSWRSVLISDGIFEVNGWGDWRPNSRVLEGGSSDPNLDRAGRGRYRHRNRANFLVANGQVGSLPIEEAWAMPNHGYLEEITPTVLR